MLYAPPIPLESRLIQRLDTLIQNLSPLQLNYVGSCIRLAEDACAAAKVPCSLQQTLRLTDQRYKDLLTHPTSWKETDPLKASMALRVEYDRELAQVKREREVDDEEWLQVRVFQKGLLMRRIAFHSLYLASQHLQRPNKKWRFLEICLNAVQERLALGAGIIGFQWGETGEIKRGVLGRYCDSYIDYRLFQLDLGPTLASTKIEGRVTKTVEEIYTRRVFKLGRIGNLPLFKKGVYNPFWVTDLHHDASYENVSMTLLGSSIKDENCWFTLQKELQGRDEVVDFMQELGYRDEDDEPQMYIPELREIVLRRVQENRQLFWYPVVRLNRELQP